MINIWHTPKKQFKKNVLLQGSLSELEGGVLSAHPPAAAGAVVEAGFGDGVH